LRNGDSYPSFKSDLAKVHAAPSVWEAPDWELHDHEADAVPYLLSLLSFPSQPLVLDIEVGIEKDTHFGHPEQYQLLCIGIVFDWGVHVIGEEALKDPVVRQALDDVLHHHQIVCHNGKFDLALWPDVKLYFDTMLASYITDERPGTNSLEYCSTEILGSPSWKDEVERYLGKDKNYADIPRDVLYKYNAFDIWNTWLLYKHYVHTMTEEELANHDMLCELSAVLMHAEMHGSNLDKAYLDDLNEQMVEELKELEAAVKWVDNPRSPKQVKEAFHELGAKIGSTDEKTLTVLRRKTRKAEVIAFIDSLLAYRGRQKLHSTYVKGLLSREYKGRIHPSFLIHGTTTGRLSSRNPNIQNQPRGPLIRTAFLPDPGYVYIQADYKTAELRVIGIESDDLWLRDVLSDPNRDIHGEVADRFFGPGLWDKDQRVRAKAVVFGLSYGREAGSIAQEYGISQAEAQEYIDTFFEQIPGVQAWYEEMVHKTIYQGIDLTNHFGRKRRFHLITKDNKYDIEKQAKAFIPQSTANDICFRAAIELYKEGMDIRILVHDSILVQARPEDADRIGSRMATVMEQVAREQYSDKIPFFVDVEVGSSWGALN
jgi:DNA polymerase-1